MAVTINTNGTKVNNDIAKLFKEHDVAVSVSLDGFENFHDKNRIKRNGEGSFKESLDGFKLLKDFGVQTGVSCTVTNDILDSLPEITRWFIKDIGIDFLGFNPLTSGNKEFSNNENYINKYTNAVIASFKVAREFGCYEDRLMRKVEAFARKTICPFDCAGCGRQIVVTPDGNIGVCHAYLDSRRHFSNEISSKFNAIEDPCWIEWCSRSPIAMKECIDCEAVGICGGGCPFNAEIDYGSIWALDKSFCIYSKHVLEWLIWDAWEIQ